MELNIATFNTMRWLELWKQTSTAFRNSQEQEQCSVTACNIIRNDNSTGAALLVRKEYYFEEVVVENLLVSFNAWLLQYVTPGNCGKFKNREPIYSDAGRATFLAESFDREPNVSLRRKDPTLTSPSNNRKRHQQPDSRKAIRFGRKLHRRLSNTVAARMALRDHKF